MFSYSSMIPPLTFSVFNSKIWNCFSSFFYGSSNFHLKIRESCIKRNLKSTIFVSKYRSIFSDEIFHQDFKNTIVEIVETRFFGCESERGGAIYAEFCEIRLRNCFFESNNADIGGAIHSMFSSRISISKTSFYNNTATYNGALNGDISSQDQNVQITGTNMSMNQAEKWTGALRIDRSCSSLSYCMFSSNSANVCGCIFDFNCDPLVNDIRNSVFLNNSSISRSGAFCCFHIKHRSRFNRVSFYYNDCQHDSSSISLQSIDQIVTINDCIFSGKRENEIGMRYGKSSIEMDKCLFNVDDSTINLSIQQFISVFDEY